VYYYGMKSNSSVVPVAVAITVALLSALTVAHAASTIGTSIQTDGMLSVTGTTTLMGNVGIPRTVHSTMNPFPSCRLEGMAIS
jgi:hypothetical protein